MNEILQSFNAFGDLGLAALIVWRLFIHDKRLTILETKVG